MTDGQFRQLLEVLRSISRSLKTIAEEMGNNALEEAIHYFASDGHVTCNPESGQDKEQDGRS